MISPARGLGDVGLLELSPKAIGREQVAGVARVEPLTVFILKLNLRVYHGETTGKEATPKFCYAAEYPVVEVHVVPLLESFAFIPCALS